jgi:ABC-type transport system involved in cytochrome c biogenesis permease subunit
LGYQPGELDNPVLQFIPVKAPFLGSSVSHWGFSHQVIALFAWFSLLILLDRSVGKGVQLYLYLQVVLSTLVQRAKTLCDLEILREEIKHLNDTFKRNAMQLVQSKRHQAGCTSEAEGRTRKEKGRRYSCTPLPTDHI